MNLVFDDLSNVMKFFGLFDPEEFIDMKMIRNSISVNEKKDLKVNLIQ